MARSNPTVQDNRNFLESNGWTAEEIDAFLEKHSRFIEGEQTLLSHDAWEILAMEEVHG